LEPYSARHVALGRAVRKIRRDQGITQEDLAARCKIDRAYFGAIERGEANVTFARLLTICDTLDIQPPELLEAYADEVSSAGTDPA
jgi:transcriptional regulator with XRE-family HTH domain